MGWPTLVSIHPHTASTWVRRSSLSLANGASGVATNSAGGTRGPDVVRGTTSPGTDTTHVLGDHDRTTRVPATRS